MLEYLQLLYQLLARFCALPLLKVSKPMLTCLGLALVFNKALSAAQETS